MLLPAMAMSDQVAKLRDYKLAISDAFDRRSQWPEVSAALMKTLQARVSEWKEETDLALELGMHNEHDARTIQLSLGSQRAWRSAEKSYIEIGAALLITLAWSGFVQFVFVPARVDGEHAKDAELLGKVEPFEAHTELDRYVEQFLTRAAETHWSRV